MRFVSGLQPTGTLHLGNYLGAVRQWVTLQDEGECVFILADLHAITVDADPARLVASVREMTAALLAAGIDPARSILFNHSRVPAHPELAWILSCTARMGWLNRMSQFKEISGKNREGASVGLYAYPMLQAADILLYRATHVPVGRDQKQHVELGRDVAAKFNADFGVQLFTLPEALVAEETGQIMSLRNGNARMSKSDPSDMSRINLTDDDDLIVQKIRKAKTDAEPLPDNVDALTNRPEALNLVRLHAALSGRASDQVLEEFAGQGFGTFKPVLAELMVEALRPIRQRIEQLREEPAHLDSILAQGAERAAAEAGPMLEGAYEAVGLGR
ncbi:tryptophan--tRNA ligase [Sphingosinicella rhizophila]|uniref:Tryptophan--tRNA ligase n=1 Tax=Sphingosinicella rhizophila TaxID=3050082 RepID=A0ABU3Q9C6_9SPHN|nr:tryptophan--tRNA ligase [Sphingosinicella sp. GR2756]MDT9599994.1 tryptophan--tRNA ligase [Sphingosinicella sp. GR2756]